MYKRKRSWLTGILIIAILGLFIFGCGPKYVSTPYTGTGFYFDTVINITIYDSGKSECIQGCYDIAEKYENLWSRTIEDSEISQINSAGLKGAEVSDETINVLKYALNYCEESDGAFDITLGALSDLWNIKDNTGEIPSEEDIEEALGCSGYEHIIIEGNTVKTDIDGVVIDLGAIAKGYIADKMKEYLVSEGVTSAIINLGGNVMIVGSKPDKSDFNVGIRYPFKEADESIMAVKVSDKSVVTSGTYERYFEKDGKIYHHLMNTSTGYPIDNGLISVTIISDNSVDGDALATMCFAMGAEKGLQYINSQDEIEAFFITSDYDIIFSDGMGTDISYTDMR